MIKANNAGDAAKIAAEVGKLPTIPKIAAPALPKIDVPRMPKISVPAFPKIDLPTAKQIAEVQKHFQALTGQNAAWFDQMREAQRRIAESMRALTSGFEAYKPILAEISRAGNECERIEAAGWLPHYTTPFDKLMACGDEPGEMATVLTSHYLDEWPAIEASFRDHLSTYDLDDEAKETFRQVLSAHGHGLYRLTARSLFPEIERVVRTEIHEGSLQPITSQKRLKELAGSLGLRDTQPGGMYAMSLFRKFLKHLYEHANTLEQLEAIAADHVPNRHASLHGLLSYASAQNSVNALVMADFLFQIVCALKGQSQEAEEMEQEPVEA